MEEQAEKNELRESEYSIDLWLAAISVNRAPDGTPVSIIRERSVAVAHKVTSPTIESGDPNYSMVEYAGEIPQKPMAFFTHSWDLLSRSILYHCTGPAAGYIRIVFVNAADSDIAEAADTYLAELEEGWRTNSEAFADLQRAWLIGLGYHDEVAEKIMQSAEPYNVLTCMKWVSHAYRVLKKIERPKCDPPRDLDFDIRAGLQVLIEPMKESGDLVLTAALAGLGLPAFPDGIGRRQRIAHGIELILCYHFPDKVKRGLID